MNVWVSCRSIDAHGAPYTPDAPPIWGAALLPPSAHLEAQERRGDALCLQRAALDRCTASLHSGSSRATPKR
ncbi:hypothetical protein BN2475_130077 [Paraburkholderia ribeironis]|uniref:Uncharacterized protein n=1 Tax=Paraburkholderia ribeironis TaxID=1247936 RepID=A0A1N7RSE0_9BURK|nr:hypothetical protein BN2475_130077 [Paraburkholderia ribeironis]